MQGILCTDGRFDDIDFDARSQWLGRGINSALNYLDNKASKSKHTRGSNERYLRRTRQNNVHIFGKVCHRHSDVRADKHIYTRDVVNTHLNVTFEEMFSNAPTFAKIEFGNVLKL